MLDLAMATANRRLLDAIEAPPDAGVEDSLDRLAAATWYYATHVEQPPDPGRVCHMVVQLTAIERRTNGRKARLVREAREAIKQAAGELEAV